MAMPPRPTSRRISYRPTVLRTSGTADVHVAAVGGHGAFHRGGSGVVCRDPPGGATGVKETRGLRKSRGGCEALRRRSPHDLPSWTRGVPRRAPGGGLRRPGGQRARRVGVAGALRRRPRARRPRHARWAGLRRRGRRVDGRPRDRVQLALRRGRGPRRAAVRCGRRAAQGHADDGLARHGRAVVARLTDREQQVLTLIAEGHPTREVAEQLCYSERTVKNVLHDVVTKLNARSRSQAVAHAVREWLI